MTPHTPSGQQAVDRDTEALAEFLNSECEFADGLVGTSWPQHSQDDGYRGDSGYVRLTPPDVVARRREDAKAILTFLSQRRTAAPTAPGHTTIDPAAQPTFEVVSKRTGAVWLTTHDPHYIDDWVTRNNFTVRPVPTAPSTALTDAHVRAADEAWLKAEGGIRGAIRATFAAGYEAAVNERAAALGTAAGEREALSAPRAFETWDDMLEAGTRAVMEFRGWKVNGEESLLERADENPRAREWVEQARAVLNAVGFDRDTFRTALATPPAQSVPWEEQAARQCEEWALLLSAKGSNAAKVFDRIQFNADAVKLRDHARAFRALLSKPAKGDTTNAD